MIIKLVHVLFQITDVMIFKKRKKKKKRKNCIVQENSFTHVTRFGKTHCTKNKK